MTTDETAKVKMMALNRGEQDKDYAITYHNWRKTQREAWAYEIMKEIGDVGDKSFISLGCGFAGEEAILAQYFGRTVLVDRFALTTHLVEEIYNDLGLEAEVLCMDINALHLNEKFDFIYTSGPSDWHNADLWYDPPKYYFEIINEHMQANGVFLARLYDFGVPGKSKADHLKPENIQKFIDNLNEYNLGLDKRIIEEDSSENNYYYIKRQ